MRKTPRDEKLTSSCDWKMRAGGGRRKAVRPGTRVHKFTGNYTWRGIKRAKYKAPADDWRGVIRQVLIGERGEGVAFHARYFEIAPRGFTSLEVHRHEHVVIGIRGRGYCSAGRRKIPIGYLDVVYIGPHEPHQLRNRGEEPFGFLCIVNAKRDRPKIIDHKSPARGEKRHHLTRAAAQVSPPPKASRRM